MTPWFTKYEEVLKKADDAIEVDTTGLNIEQVTNKIISIIEGKNV